MIPQPFLDLINALVLAGAIDGKQAEVIEEYLKRQIEAEAEAIGRYRARQRARVPWWRRWLA